MGCSIGSVCTATVHRVPHVWFERTRPGGVIVTGFGTPYHQEALLRLEVHADRTATGAVVATMECEWVRGQRIRPVLTVAEAEAAVASCGTTTLDLDDVAGDFDASFAIGARVPDCASVFVAPDDQWFVDGTTGSWAQFMTQLHLRAAGPPHLINQYGPRALWDEIEDAYRWWYGAGRPRAADWPITVHGDGATVIEPPGRPEPATLAAAG
jgi:hypothetical protein